MLKSLVLKLNRLRLTLNGQRNFLIYCSVAVGLFGGLAAVTLKFLVHFMEELSRDISSHLPYHIIYVFLPALGILLTVSWFIGFGGTYCLYRRGAGLQSGPVF
jgi:CIC family chloride channel protein